MTVFERFRTTIVCHMSHSTKLFRVKIPPIGNWIESKSHHLCNDGFVSSGIVQRLSVKCLVTKTPS